MNDSTVNPVKYSYEIVDSAFFIYFGERDSKTKNMNNNKIKNKRYHLHLTLYSLLGTFTTYYYYITIIVVAIIIIVQLVYFGVDNIRSNLRACVKICIHLSPDVHLY